ncbi:MAG: hypothetical protein ACNFW9_05290 [Candidatus Kerfeldbacteria bacterium]|jgi:hypothetical protein
MIKTKLGKWSVGLMGSFILWMMILIILIITGQKGGDTFFSNPLLSISAVIAALSGFISLIVGLVAIIKHKEKAALVYISTFLSLLITIYIFAEIIFPH